MTNLVSWLLTISLSLISTSVFAEKTTRFVAYGPWVYKEPLVLLGVVLSQAYATRTIDLIDKGASIYSCVQKGDIDLDENNKPVDGLYSPRFSIIEKINGGICPFAKEESGLVSYNLEANLN